MINYIEKGFGLFSFLEQHGVNLYQLNNVWSYAGDKSVEEVNALIAEYNPWPVMKAKQMAIINAEFSAAVDQLVAGTTPDERNSWAVQESEATAYMADNNKPCPALSVLASVRGVPLDVLVQKVLEKSALFKQYYFTFQGMRDKAEDMVKALPNEGEYDRLGELEPIHFGV